MEEFNGLSFDPSDLIEEIKSLSNDGEKITVIVEYLKDFSDGHNKLVELAKDTKKMLSDQAEFNKEILKACTTIHERLEIVFEGHKPIADGLTSIAECIESHTRSIDMIGDMLIKLQDYVYRDI